MRQAVLLFAIGCTGESTSTTVQPAIAANAIAANAIAANAIAANAITSNAIAANAIAANAISSGGILVGAVSDPNVSLALEDPNARIFLDYLVGCALAPEQHVTWTSRLGGAPYKFKGRLGLCPAWQTGSPDQACRERVSACILARNNAFGVSVQFSIRGEQQLGLPLALGDRVPPHDHIPRTNRVVESLAGCMRAGDGELRDCGWDVDAIGICVPGTNVSIAAGNYAECAGDWLGVEGSGNEVMRVCAGTSACDSRFAIASVDDSCGGAAPGIDFVCPAEGHYAVMKASYYAHGPDPDGQIASTAIHPSLCNEIVCDANQACCGGNWDASCEVVAETACHYPATEARVFRWREGSFYGDLFGAANLNPAKPQIRVNKKTLKVESQTGDGFWTADNGQLSRDFVGVTFPSMYACASSNWREGDAYIMRRVCAGPDPKDPTLYTRNCAANYVGKCFDVCKTLDMIPLGDYDAAACRGGKRTWPNPMTTLLASPQDAIPDLTYSTTVSSTPILNW